MDMQFCDMYSSDRSVPQYSLVSGYDSVIPLNFRVILFSNKTQLTMFSPEEI